MLVAPCGVAPVEDLAAPPFRTMDDRGEYPGSGIRSGGARAILTRVRDLAAAIIAVQRHS